MAIYNYEAKFDWNTKCKKLGATIPQSDVEAELFPNMENVARLKFDEQKAKITAKGHSCDITGVTTAITVYDVKPEYNWQGQPLEGPNYYHFYTIEGTTIISFDTDIADALAEDSPQLLEIIGLVILAIAAAIIAHPVLFLAILLVIAFAILASQLVNVTTGITNLISTPQGAIIGIAATIGVIIILILVLLFYMGKGKGKGK